MEKTFWNEYTFEFIDSVYSFDKDLEDTLSVYFNKRVRK